MNTISRMSTIAAAISPIQTPLILVRWTWPFSSNPYGVDGCSVGPVRTVCSAAAGRRNGLRRLVDGFG